MPFTAPQLADAGKAAIDYFLKNDPIDNINVTHPLLKKLMDNKMEYAGGLQFVVEQLRFSNASNFQSYFTDGAVTYNVKKTLDQAKFTWSSFHDGFGLDEDTLAQNGITMTDDKTSVPSDAEKVQLTNLLKENMETLKLGFQEKFDVMIHRNGAQDPEDLPGLDLLVQTIPTAVSSVGGIPQATALWWQNYADLTLDRGAINMAFAMEKAWRACIRVGGEAPNFILCGTNFLDTYRLMATKDSIGGIQRHVIVGGNTGNRQGSTIDPGIGSGVSSGLYFKGVELIWDPNFSVVDALAVAAPVWEDRCYMLNMNHIKLRPIKGHWMVSRKPPRVYDKYVHYFALTAKAALTTNKRNAHAVLALVP